MTEKKLFLKQLTNRVMKKNLNANILVEGDYTGVGKSYLTMKLCEDFHNVHKDKLDPFTEKNIFFKPEGFLQFTIHGKQYSCSIYDDAGATAGNRNWFDEVIKMLGTTAQTYRFRNLIMFITVPFGIEIDVDLRRLCHYNIVVHDRGYAKVYRTTFKKFANKGRGGIFFNHIFDIGDKKDLKKRLPMPSKELCDAYELKKSTTFTQKYEDDLERIHLRDKQQEWNKLKARSDDEIMDEILGNLDKYRNKAGSIDTSLIRYHSKVGMNRSQYIKNLLNELHEIS